MPFFLVLVTPTVATRIEDKANVTSVESIPDYLLVIIIILAIMIVVFPFYWVYKYCTRKAPELDAEDAKPRRIEGTDFSDQCIKIVCKNISVAEKLHLGCLMS